MTLDFATVDEAKGAAMPEWARHAVLKTHDGLWTRTGDAGWHQVLGLPPQQQLVPGWTTEQAGVDYFAFSAEVGDGQFVAALQVVDPAQVFVDQATPPILVEVLAFHPTAEDALRAARSLMHSFFGLSRVGLSDLT